VYLYLIFQLNTYISTDHISKGTRTIISVQVRQTNKRAEEPDAEPIMFHLLKYLSVRELIVLNDYIKKTRRGAANF